MNVRISDDPSKPDGLIEQFVLAVRSALQRTRCASAVSLSRCGSVRSFRFRSVRQLGDRATETSIGVLSLRPTGDIGKRPPTEAALTFSSEETRDLALFNLAIASAWRRSMAFDSTQRTGYSQLQRGYSFRNMLLGVQGPPCFRPAAPSTSLLLLSLREY
jgi:hypothetical protein